MAQTQHASGLFAEGIQVDPPRVMDPAPWTDWTVDRNCLALNRGAVDRNAKTIQVLAKDTQTGDQKAFTAHIGDVFTLGRFTVKVTVPSGTPGAVLLVGFYWS